MLALLYLSCALLDGYVTYRILSAYGVGLEFNPLVRFLSPRVGLINSLLLSVILPRLISLGVLGAIGSETCLHSSVEVAS
jgi:hypothetical protein